ncbi:MAG: MopE-related protein [Sandaracinus sp.]
MNAPSARSPGFLAIVFLVGACSLGCDNGGVSLSVRLQTGLRTGVEARYADVRLLEGVSRCEAGTPALHTEGRVLETGDQDQAARGVLGLADFGGLQAGLYTVRVRLLRPPASPGAPADSGAAFVERCVAITLSSDRVLRIPITSNCVDVVCPAPGGDTGYNQCLNGRCVDPRCNPDDPATAPFCCDRRVLGDACDSTPTLCAAASDCVGGPSCAAAATCEGGACIEPVEDRCGPAQHCSTSEDRCVDDPVFVDGGMIDASTPAPDAGPPGMGLICDPCTVSAECQSGAVCVSLAVGSSVCVPTCSEADPTCPPGLACMPMGAARACAPVGGRCCVDGDDDGYGVGRGCLGADCDDADPLRHPGQIELCNGVDDDCDTTPDDPPTECASGRCDASGAGYAESGGQSCTSGSCMDSGTSTPCALFTCDGGGDAGDHCARTCTALGADDDLLCVTSAHCDAGACVADVSSGGGCDEDGDCASGVCSSGTCCTPGVGGCMCPGGPVETVCDDGADSDCDASVDCADSDCNGQACGSHGRLCAGASCACPGGATESACSDGADNDCDGLVDCGDADCGGRACDGAGRLCVGGGCACPGGSVETQCDDGVNNDCDAGTDCDDLDCELRTCGAGRICDRRACMCASSFELSCSNHADDDCDGAVDCADSDCAAQVCGDAGRTCSGSACVCSGGGSETRCDDAVDGDCDGATDCADGDCNGRSCAAFGRVCGGSACVCPGGSESCSNGSDDDCDGQLDCDDPECAGQTCASGRTCMGGACTCAGGPNETSCGDGIDNDCDGPSDCDDPDCARRDCGGGQVCCGTCQTLPPMYSSYDVSAAECMATLGGSPANGLCAMSMYYHSECGIQDMSPWAPGWQHSPSNPAGCDYNGCDGAGNCQENFCIPCPGGDCALCPGSPVVTPC